MDHHKTDKHVTYYYLIPFQFPIKLCINPIDEGPLLNIGACAPLLVTWHESQVNNVGLWMRMD